MTAVILILSALLRHNPSEIVIRDRCSIIEINHYYDTHAVLVFSQQIFWDWDIASERFQVVAWRLVKHHTQKPIYRNDLRRWQVLWLDGNTLRSVTAAAYRETWTQYDPELDERSVLHKDKRRGLSQMQSKIAATHNR